MDADEYTRTSAVGLAAAVRSGSVTAVEATAAALACIAEVDDKVRAFTEVWDDAAVARASAIDHAGIAGGLPLAGVPIGIKASEGPDSWQARRLVAAGCVPIGATSAPGPGTSWQTWGTTDQGVTRNPWDPSRSPGGSSAGSAVAVATGMVPLATGGDGAGSVRLPAAWCCVVGLKPTTGSLPARDPAGLTVPGPLARSVTDAAAYLDVLAGTDLVGELTRPGPGLRAAWSADLGFAATDSDIAGVAEAAFDAACGTAMSRVNVPLVLSDPGPAWFAARGRTPDPRAEALRSHNDAVLATAFDAVDIVATPTTPNPPHGHDGPGETMSVALTWAFNLSGHPAISVPAGRTATGEPVGLQFVARHGRELDLLRAGSLACPRPVPATG